MPLSILAVPVALHLIAAAGAGVLASLTKKGFKKCASAFRVSRTVVAPITGKPFRSEMRRLIAKAGEKAPARQRPAYKQKHRLRKLHRPDTIKRRGVS
jgi:hypothetical protein